MNRLPISAKFFRLLACFGLLIALVAMTGCPKSTIFIKPGDDGQGPGPVTIPPTRVDPGTTTPDKPAPSTPKEFYELGEFARAERLAGNLITTPGLSAQDRSEAWRYYVLSAAANNHVHLAQQSLENWANTEPGIENSSGWQDAWLGVTLRFPVGEALEKARGKDVDGESATMRGRAQAVYALKATEDAAMSSALGEMNNYYRQMSAQEKASFEGIFADQLRWQQPNFLGQLYGHISTKNATAFPYTIINLEQGRRMLFSTDANYKQSGKEILESLAGSGVLADPALATSLLDAAREQENALQALPTDMPSEGAVALLLPMQGKYAPYAEKISKGAQAAQHALAQSEVGATVIVIDTESPDWMQKVAALPKTTVIGGPLTPVAYNQGKASGLFQNRAVFTFLSQLDAGEEGASAWRFFSSPKDQIATLLKFCQDLGIYGVASLYPMDNYGERMNTAISQQSGNFGVRVASKSYAADNPDAWGVAVRELMESRAGGSSFEAVFLPDTWPAAKGVVPYFFFNREDRLVIMGTALWEQSLYSDRSPDSSYFYLGVFPGTWNNESSNPAKQSLVYLLNQMGGGPVAQTDSGVPGIPVASQKADFWHAIGFDFVRFAMSMGQPEAGFFGGEGWSPEQVNSRVQQAQNIDWSMAPLRWDASGQASQEMFLFTPTADGFAPANLTEFKQRMDETKRLHQQRWSQ